MNERRQITYTPTRFIEFVPLFNFEASVGERLALDPYTWLSPLNEDTRTHVVRAVNQYRTTVSRAILSSLRFGLYHQFELSDPREIRPPDQDLELDARVIFKVLRPDSRLTTGYITFYPEDGRRSHGGGRMAGEFPWSWPPYRLSPNDAERLPELWRELRKTMSPAWLWGSRFFQTTRIRLWRASLDQDERQKLLDLFIAMESLLLQGREQWGTPGRRSLPLGPRRLATLLDPSLPGSPSDLHDKIERAHKQRNTVAHGLDRDLVGFDGESQTFGHLVGETERWTTVALHRMLRLLYQAGSRDGALQQLDAFVADPGANGSVGEILLATAN